MNFIAKDGGVACVSLNGIFCLQGKANGFMLNALEKDPFVFVLPEEEYMC